MSSFASKNLSSQKDSSQVLSHRDFQNSKHAHTFRNKPNTNIALKLFLAKIIRVNKTVNLLDSLCDMCV